MRPMIFTQEAQSEPSTVAARLTGLLLNETARLYSDNLYVRFQFVLEGTDLSAVITWVCLGFCALEPHALQFLCTCQLDLERVSEFRSIERFSTAVTTQQVMSRGASLISQTRLELRHH